MKKKVCMLLCYLPFLDARVFECEAKSLVKHGYEVTIIAPRKDSFLFDIDGKPFTNRFREKNFDYQGIKIVTYDSEKRTANPLSDPLYQLGLKEEADFYHAHELNSFFYGKEIKVALRKQNGKNIKLIYDSRQLMPDPFSLNINEETRKKWKGMLLENLEEVDSIITVSDSIKSWYLSIDPLLPVEVIYNSPPLTTNFNVKGDGDYTQRFVVAHEGNVSKETIKKIFSATESCSKIMDILLKLVGGPRHGESISIPNHLQTIVNLSGWVSYHSLPNVMSDVDIGLIDLDSTQSLNNAFAMPSKFFSYLNNGVPVLVSKCSDMEKFVNTYQCGLVLNKVNPAPSDYVKGILYLYRNKPQLKQMSINARKVMEEIYCWEKMEQRLTTVYSSLESNRTQYLLS
ncbi:glycosyltransferase family protein [Virgibacillus necropolis]|uniref:Glycosyl transferase family 1 n=1 Tax=Virgibacillus necropolis TaxID=163877 RepID=A0A221M9U1_9BACI|nr:glycosyltransferase [Virgibacillus necropolis]ASN04426.1 glycosyl transferase family 1 [Virgibacillus necropolis]